MKTSHISTILLRSSLVVLAFAFGPSSAWATRGGDHSGGGNSLNYRIIESYVKPLEEIDGYQRFLAPILEDIRTKLPLFHDRLQARMTEMTWYIVPTRVKPVAQEYTGLPFDSDQLAVQNTVSGEVFMDQNMFGSIPSESEKGRQLLHEIVENTVLNFGSYCDTLPDQCMKIVRVTVNLLSKSRSMNAEQLSESLKKLGWRNVETATQVEQMQKEEQQQKEKEAEEIRQNLPVYKLILDQLFSGLDPYCASVGQLGVTYQQVKFELSRSQKKQLKDALIQLSKTTLPIAFRGGVLNIEWARDWGLSTSDVLPLYNQLISSWVNRDMKALFFQTRTIPTLKYATSLEADELSENIVNLHRVCAGLTQMKESLYQFVGGQR